jgi:hypothetical protein
VGVIVDSVQQLRVVWWRLVPGGLLLVGLGVGVGWSWHQPGQAPAPAASEAPLSERTAEAKRLAALEREVRALRATLTPRPLPEDERPQEPSAQVLTSEPAAPKLADPAEAARRGEQHRAEFLDALSRKVDTEPYDPRWRAETERSLLSVLPAQFGPDIAVEEAACAASVCRVRLRHPGSTRLPTDKVSKFLDHRGALANLELQVDAREQGTTTFYFVRDATP